MATSAPSAARALAVAAPMPREPASDEGNFVQKILGHGDLL
jgi:hypothetical protein